MAAFPFVFISAIVLFLPSRAIFAAYNLRPLESIIDGRASLVSPDGRFEFGFFSPGSAKNRYLGIWYKNIPIPTYVWVANRCKPINDSSGLLMINSTTSNLVLFNQNKSVVWSTNSFRQAQKPILELLDSGNLVLRDEKERNSENYLWQSFDHPCDTLIPGMKLGWDLRIGLNRHVRAWKNTEDPCPGDLNYGLDLNDYPEIYIRKGSKKYYRTGPWNGLQFSGIVQLRKDRFYGIDFVNNDEEVYFLSYLTDNSIFTRLFLNPMTSMRERLTWNEAKQSWQLLSSAPTDYCDNYGLCGANGNCIMGENPVCQCLRGFKPKSQEKWNSMDWSDGCIRKNPLSSCQGKDKDGFVKLVRLKPPDTTHTWVNKSMSLNECRNKCLSNCTCMAYSNSNISGGGSGCVNWFGELLDIRQVQYRGLDIYIRMPASELAKGNSKVRAAIIAAVIGAVSGMFLVGFFIFRRTSKVGDKNIRWLQSVWSFSLTFLKSERNRILTEISGGQKEALKLPLFNLSKITTATDNFSVNNKLGEGGFGPVYKGVLKDGKEIAVKRLSLSSGQGIDEFKNEVILIAKLQHRNLVKLLGCCIQGEEKLLVYEYMPNKSLDSFIFDETQGKQLDWPKRFQIISGIARGLLYLHQDSRLRIIHRDLKASNILLDNAMNPKISDFGLARTFGGDEQTQGRTKRVIGTYGYMAPEYAFKGQFSIKSDVFSFGTLVLEIVSGKKSTGFHHKNHNLTLIGYAWTLMREGRTCELIDKCIRDSHQNLQQVLRCIHVGLLCVQQQSVDRPRMSSVVMMLGSENGLPQPKPPGFFTQTDSAEGDHSGAKPQSSSTNDMTITELKAR